MPVGTRYPIVSAWLHTLSKGTRRPPWHIETQGAQSPDRTFYAQRRWPVLPASRTPRNPAHVLILRANELSYYCATIALMAVRKKRSISMPPDLDAEIEAAAAESGLSYSAWLAQMVRKEFTIRAGLAAVSQYAEEHGAFSAEETAEADEWAAQAIARSARARAAADRRSA